MTTDINKRVFDDDMIYLEDLFLPKGDKYDEAVTKIASLEFSRLTSSQKVLNALSSVLSKRDRIELGLDSDVADDDDQWKIKLLKPTDEWLVNLFVFVYEKLKSVSFYSILLDNFPPAVLAFFRPLAISLRDITLEKAINNVEKLLNIIPPTSLNEISQMPDFDRVKMDYYIVKVLDRYYNKFINPPTFHVNTVIDKNIKLKYPPQHSTNMSQAVTNAFISAHINLIIRQKLIYFFNSYINYKCLIDNYGIISMEITDDDDNDDDLFNLDKLFR